MCSDPVCTKWQRRPNANPWGPGALCSERWPMGAGLESLLVWAEFPLGWSIERISSVPQWAIGYSELIGCTLVPLGLAVMCPPLWKHYPSKLHCPEPFRTHIPSQIRVCLHCPYFYQNVGGIWQMATGVVLVQGRAVTGGITLEPRPPWERGARHVISSLSREAVKTHP